MSSRDDHRPEWQPGVAWLFCPADRPDRYVKALALADIVVLDLEDAVAPDRRALAREHVRDLARDGRWDAARTVVRINGVGTPDHGPALELLAGVEAAAVMLAKCESAQDVEALAVDRVVPLIETPLGVENAGLIAAAGSVSAVMWGADDLVAGLGGFASRGRDGLYRDVARYARSRVLVAAKAHGRLAVDAVFMEIPDEDGLRAETEDALAVGFDAKVAIHPRQVPVLREAFTPAPDRVDWAARLLATVDAEGGVASFEGRMVDGPVFAQAQRILRLAGRR
ncbi:MAG TPA: CoA ester lyase [Kineosporiaceae bacterium]